MLANSTGVVYAAISAGSVVTSIILTFWLSRRGYDTVVKQFIHEYKMFRKTQRKNIFELIEPFGVIGAVGLAVLGQNQFNDLNVYNILSICLSGIVIVGLFRSVRKFMKHRQ